MISLPLRRLEMKQSQRIAPIWVASLAQLLALAFTGLILLSLVSLGWAREYLTLIVIQSVLAVTLSVLLRMPPWWLVIQAVFVPAVIAVLSLSIAPTWFLGGFVLLTLIYGRTYTTQVPLYLSRRPVWRAIQNQLPQTSALRILDLGSGLGGLVQHLARTRPDSQVVGIESAPLPSWISKLRLIRSPNAQIIWRDFWQTDLSEYDVVCAYLSPVPMPDLWEKVQSEMRPGTIFLSYRFSIPGAVPAQVIPMNDFGQTELYVWRL